MFWRTPCHAYLAAFPEIYPHHIRLPKQDDLHSLVHSDQHNKQCSPSQPSSLPDIPSTITMRAISENHSGPNRPSNNFGFDGVSDRVDVSATRSSPPKSPVNLYKALPEAPGASPARAPLSGRTDTSSFVHSQDTTNRPSTASSVYSGLSHTSSKTKFKVMTRSLVDPEAERAPASPVYQPDMHLHPSKYDPGNLPKSPRTWVIIYTSYVKSY